MESLALHEATHASTGPASQRLPAERVRRDSCRGLESTVDVHGRIVRNGHRRTQITTRTRADGSVETLLTTYEYDAQGRLTRTIDPDGTSTRTVYDEIGRQKETFDKLGRKTTYDYDEMGRLTKTTHADTTSEESTYDALLTGDDDQSSR